MLTKPGGNGVCRLALFHAIRNFLAYSDTLDHEIAQNILEFILNWIEKVKPGFSFSSMCMVSKLNRAKS